ncbi:transposase [Povalibacter sp.]|uniref:transposase n=1 Tax=Povalibacter sp. TaxID=1962978 RepID=UPI002F40A6BD
MSRRPRIQIPGGTYYVLQSTGHHHPLFHEQSDYAHLESLLARTGLRTHTTVYAFCWLPHTLHLAVRTRETPVSRFMQGFTSRYAQYVHGHSNDSGHLFAHRFQSVLIDPQAWLPALVRYIHHAPVRAGLCTHPRDYPHSSHGAFVGERRIGWLDTDTVPRLLREQGHSHDSQHTAYFETGSTTEELDLLSRNGKCHTRFLGDAEFAQRLPHAHRPKPPRLTVAQLIDAVAVAQNIPREHILSISRSRRTALARSLIAWHATERRIATLTAVSRALRRDPSTLSKVIARNRVQHPDLFRLDALRHLQPLG